MKKNLYKSLEGILFFRTRKLFRIMKLTSLMLLVPILSSLAHNSYSQSKKLTLQLEEKSVQDVLNTIQDESEYYAFLYSENVIDVNRKVDVDVREKSINEVLDEVFSGTDITYKIKDRVIVLSTPEIIEIEPVKLQQEFDVTGTVTNESGEPMPGVTVVVKGTNNGAITNLEGQYILNDVPPNSTLVFSFMGMKTQEIEIGNQTTIDVTLEADAIGLDEVVAIGYGTMKKRNLTGAVASVDMESIENRVIQDVGAALKGQVAGVQVVQHTGKPGASPTIQVRGLNSITAGQVPLLVIDGVPQEDMTDLTVVDPMNIESMEVLKGASAAAIYGSRANAGVILITTKGAKMGKLTLDVSYKASLQTLPRKVDMMDAQEYIEFMKAAAQNAWVYAQGGDPNAPNTVEARGHIQYTWPQEWDDPNVVANWPSTDWQDVWYKNAPMHKVNITGTGGTETLKYNLSGSFLDQEGLIDNGNHFNRVYLSGKLESEVTDWFRTGINFNTRFSIHKNRPEGWVFEQHGIEMPPIFPAYSHEGWAGGALFLPGDPRYPETTPSMDNYDRIYFNTAANPVAYLNDKERIRDNKTLGTIWTEFTLLEGLKFRSSFTYDLNWKERYFYRSVSRNMPEAYNWGGQMSRWLNNVYHWYQSNVLTFDRRFDEHEINVTAGFDAERSNYLGFNASAAGYSNDLIPYLSAATETTGSGDSERTSTFQSYFARAIYTLRDKYIVKGSLRYDGSSRFGSNSKWGSFPSVGLGWIISNEPFMGNVPVINNLKLRASYGLTGNDNFGDYIWIPRLSQGTTAIGGELRNFFQKASLPNEDLKWERTGMLNIGFDMSLVNNRIGLTLDYYNSRTEDLLLNLPVSSLTGFTSLLQNVGVVENKGVEVLLTSRNTVGQFKWNTAFNFAMNRGKAIELGGEEYLRPYSGSGFEVRVYEDGDRLFEYFAYDYIGTYRDQADIDNSPSYPGAEPGDAKYRDVDGDGEISTDDRTILGTMLPDFTWSMTNSFRWKGFDASFQLTSVVGGDKVNRFRRRSVWNHGGRNLLSIISEAWSPENPDSYYFKPSTSANVNSWNKRPSSYWMDPADYVKIQNITFGYNLQTSALRKAGISSVRVYLSGDNLYSFDNFIGHDPEQGAGAEGYYASQTTKHFQRGFTHSEYAIPRIYTAGINIKF